MVNRVARLIIPALWELEEANQRRLEPTDQAAPAASQLQPATPTTAADNSELTEPLPKREAAPKPEPPRLALEEAAPSTTALAPRKDTKPAAEERPGANDPARAVCTELVPEAALSLTATDPQLLATPLLDLNLTFLLHSRPSASKIIYLDFNGHTTSGTSWNDATMGSSFYSPTYDTDGDFSRFGDIELTTIQQIWQRVAKDFSPFDIDVTLQEPPNDWLARSGSSDANWGVRAVVTSYGPSSTTAAGIAFVGSFGSSSDTPVFTYNETINGACEAISHEVGHSLGLSHDGTATTTYYTGHGSTGETSWAPIMGGSYNRNVTTWDDGTYSSSNNTGSTGNYGNGADDLAVIVGRNGFGYQPDLEGNDLATATPLSIKSGTVGQFGTIETRFDTDCFSFSLLDIGNLNLNFDPYWYRAYVDGDGAWGGNSSAYLSITSDIRSTTPYPDNASNLDLLAQLYDSSGNLLYSFNDPGLATGISMQGLLAGTYYLKLDGVGFGDPTASTPTGYTDYASIGDYWISGSITSAAEPAANPVITLSLSPSVVSEDGSGNLIYTFTRSVTTANPLNVNFTVSGTAINGSDYSGLPTGSNQVVTFAANAATASIVIDPTADSTVEADESVSFLLAPGTGYSVGTTSATTGIISNDDLAPAPLAFSTKADILTGTTGVDTFVLNRLSDALWNSTPDRIANFQCGVDSIDSPLSRTSAINPKQLGAVKTQDATGIESLLNSKNFVKNGASTFTFGSGNELRTFLALNDATPGFKTNSDSIIEITGYSGNLSTLAIF